MPLVIVLFYLFGVFPAFYLATARLSLTTHVRGQIADPFTAAANASPDRKSSDGLTVLVVFLGMSVILVASVWAMQVVPDLMNWIGKWGIGFVIGSYVGGILSPKPNLRRLAAGYAAGFSLVAAAHAWPVWPSVQALQLTMCGCAVLFLRSLPIRFLTLASVALFFYDLVHVFGTELMQEAISSEGRPVGVVSYLYMGVFPIPAALDLSSDMSLVLGLGDILVPGLWVMAASRASQPWRAVRWTVGGIAVGTAATLTTLIVSEQALPALIFLLPGAAAGYWIGTRPARTP